MSSLLQKALLCVRTCVGHVPHGVLEGPDDGVQDELELSRGDGQEGREALRGGGLQEVEEVGSVFWEFFKVLTGDNESLQPAANGEVIRKKRDPEEEGGGSKGRQRTLLIMFRVHSKTASKILGISPVMCTPSLLTMVAMVLRTSGSRAAGTFLW